MASNGESFNRRALKVGLSAFGTSLLGAMVLRNTNWGPTTRALTAAGGGILAGMLIGQKLPNAGLGIIAGGLMVGGGFGANAIAQSGLLTPAAASSTTTTTGTTTGTSTTTTPAASTTGLGLGSGYPNMRGLGQGARQPLVNFQKVPAMVAPHLAAGKRLRVR